MQTLKIVLSIILITYFSATIYGMNESVKNQNIHYITDIGTIYDVERSLALANISIIDWRKKFVEEQIVPYLEELEIRDLRIEEENLKNRIREVRSHKAEKRRKK
jgi:hypothetical protein